MIMSQEDEIPEFKFEPSESILQKLKLIPTNEKITAAVGLGTLIEIFDQSGLKKEFIKCLPERKSPRSQGSYRMALTPWMTLTTSIKKKALKPFSVKEVRRAVHLAIF
jgi:hypothetical protein